MPPGWPAVCASSQACWASALLLCSECADQGASVEAPDASSPDLAVRLDKSAGKRWLCATSPTEADESMHRYRTHTCGALRDTDIGIEARLSGWCHRIRDHGGVLFIDLRDHYGLTQVVADPDSPAFKIAETLRAEWVVRVDGKVRRRP